MGKQILNIEIVITTVKHGSKAPSNISVAIVYLSSQVISIVLNDRFVGFYIGLNICQSERSGQWGKAQMIEKGARDIGGNLEIGIGLLRIGDGERLTGSDIESGRTDDIDGNCSWCELVWGSIVASELQRDGETGGRLSIVGTKRDPPLSIIGRVAQLLIADLLVYPKVLRRVDRRVKLEIQINVGKGRVWDGDWDWNGASSDGHCKSGGEGDIDGQAGDSDGILAQRAIVRWDGGFLFDEIEGVSGGYQILADSDDERRVRVAEVLIGGIGIECQLGGWEGYHHIGEEGGIIRRSDQNRTGICACSYLDGLVVVHNQMKSVRHKS